MTDPADIPGPTPLPLPRSPATIVLLGGSFDPPTRAHLSLGAAARDSLQDPGAWLLLVPAARSPFKRAGAAPDEHRVAMLRLAAQGIPRCDVWTDEIDRAQTDDPSFWVDTLRRARMRAERASFRFIIGSDQAIEFHRWREARAILELARPIILPREPVTARDRLEARLRESGEWSEAEAAALAGELVEIPAVGASSTRARELLAAASGDAELDALLDPRVLRYIRDHGLYLGDGGAPAG